MQVHSERMVVTNFAMHMRAESKEAVDVTQNNDMRCFGFKAEATVVHIRMATSLIRWAGSAACCSCIHMCFVSVHSVLFSVCIVSLLF